MCLWEIHIFELIDTLWNVNRLTDAQKRARVRN